MKEKSEKNSPLTSHFAFYHQNEALLFQFLLYESLRAHQTLKKKPSTPQHILELTGNLKSFASSWHAPQGHLPRLVHFCNLLAHHFTPSTSPFCNQLGEILERAFVLAKKCHSSLHTESEEYLKHFTKLRKEIRSFMKLLFERVSDFHDNPSVLFFILRYQEQFDAVYRESIVKKTFSNLFPEGIKQAFHFLTDRFTKTGFDHLIPTIENKLKNLECIK